jgi:hypothetical protein
MKNNMIDREEYVEMEWEIDFINFTKTIHLIVFQKKKQNTTTSPLN